jgi:hypothetical protein
MNTKAEIVANRLPRDTGTPLKDFGKHILLANPCPILDCGGKRSATPLLDARGGLKSQRSSSARKHRRRSHSAGAVQDAFIR